MFLEQNNQLKGLDIISSFFWFHEIIKDGGENLRTYLVNRRRELNLTIEMLAELADVSPQYISLLENGKRGKKVSFSVMCRLSNALNIPIDVLKDLELNYMKKRN